MTTKRAPTNIAEVWATSSDGAEEMLFSYYPDELSFEASDFIGLTEEEGRLFKFGRDRVFRSSAIAEQARAESEAEDPTHDLAVTEVKIYDAVPKSYSVIALAAYMRPHPIRLEFETESRVWHWWEGEARSPVLTSSWLVGVDEYIKKMPEYNLERQLVVAAFGPVQYRDVLEKEFDERVAEWASINGVEIPKH